MYSQPEIIQNDIILKRILQGQPLRLLIIKEQRQTLPCGMYVSLMMLSAISI